MYLSDLKGFLIIGAPILCILLFRGPGLFFRHITELIKEGALCSKQGRRSLNLIIIIINTVSSNETESTCFHDMSTLHKLL